MTMNKQGATNRDPITGSPGAHPLGTGVGAAGGAAAGAAVGSLAGPIGLLVGGTAGAIGGGALGHTVAEHVDPTVENDYWREHYTSRPYHLNTFDYDTDYAPAYAYGSEARLRYVGRKWDGSLEEDLHAGWDHARQQSRLAWQDAKDAVRDAWERDDRTFNIHESADAYYRNAFADQDRDPRYDFETDYRPAYRYGTHARSLDPREWSDAVETDLASGWERAKDTSRMGWDDARSAVKQAWHHFERALPGDLDDDGF